MSEMGEYSEVDPAVDGIDELRRHDEAELFELLVCPS